MPLLIKQHEPAPSAANTKGAIDWALKAAQALLDYIRGLYLLDQDLRAQRTLNAERAMVFTSSTVGFATPIRLRDLVNSLDAGEYYTTALIAFDSTSGAGRWRIDGGAPTPGGGAGTGMPINAGGATLVITGLANIRDFQVIGETANLLMSVTLFK
jgi:hypothetical protein